MSDAVDDYYEATQAAAERWAVLAASIRERCPAWNCEPRLFRNNDGLLECKDCAETFDD